MQMFLKSANKAIYSHGFLLHLLLIPNAWVQEMQVNCKGYLRKSDFSLLEMFECKQTFQTMGHKIGKHNFSDNVTAVLCRASLCLVMIW